MTSDYKLYKKARRRVISRIVFDFLFATAMVIGTDFLLGLDFLRFQETGLDPYFRLLALGEILAYLILFSLMGLGKKAIRLLYWPFFILECLTFYIPFKFCMEDFNHFMLYAAWMALLFLRLVVLLQMGLWFHRNKWARIYYDHVVDEDQIEEEPVQAVQPVQTKIVYVQQPVQPVQQVQQVKQPEPEEEEEEEVPITYPQAAIRLGAAVYVELVAFPMLVQFFQGWFASYDLQQVFATREMFLLCIFTAFVWTFPIFFLYYNQKGSRAALFGSIGAEVLFSLWFCGRMAQYWRTGDYPLRVFVIFVVLDIIRYLILLWVSKPVLNDTAVREEEKPINLDDIEL